ncbi:MAG: hypothetical protein AAFV53_21760 [Myxococcota bacterium]
MVIIWRGAGIVVPLLFILAAGIVSFFIEDTTIGNATFMGWSLLLAGVFNILPTLVVFGMQDEDQPKTRHTFFFLPIWVWMLGCMGLGGVLLCSGSGSSSETADIASDAPPSEQALGKWTFSRCMQQCSPEAEAAVKSARIVVTAETVTMNGKTQTYEVLTDESPRLVWELEDGSRQFLVFLEPGSMVTEVPTAQGSTSVVFSRGGGWF